MKLFEKLKNEKTKSKLVALIDGMIWIVSAYLLGAFTSLSFNPADWTWAIRLCLGIFLFVAELSVFKKYLIAEAYRRKQKETENIN